MPNHFAAVGFSVQNDEDLRALAERASQRGDPIAAPSGFYLRYRVDDQIEIWAQATPIGDLLDCVPHYNGESRIQVGIADLIRRPDRPLDGSVYGWVNPTGPTADGGDYPIVVKIPDYETFRARVTPRSVVTMQITAFTNEIAVFESEQAFAESQPDRQRMGAESFIPTGLFADVAPDGDNPEAHAIFSGHVNAVETKRNPETSLDFCHMLVSTFGGVYDVVADLSLVPSIPPVGGVIRGSFWLVGRLAV